MIQPLTQTLVEQLNLNQHEIEYRKHLFNFTETDVACLTDWHDYMAGCVENIVVQFYSRQVESAEIAEIIGDADTLRRLHVVFIKHVLELFGGVYDIDYVNSRLRVGKVHRRMGVTPRLYISSMRLLQSLVEAAMNAAEAHGRDPASIAAAKLSVRKIFLFDTQFILDAYIDSFIHEADQAKREVEAYANSLEIQVTDKMRQMRENSIKDSLTGLYNYRALIDYLAREIAVAERYSLPLSLIYFDLNGFKKINDISGHDRGDEILAHVGKVITDTVRQIDIPCRYGGDEFCIVLPRTDITAAQGLAARLITRSRRLLDDSVSFSIGIVQSGPEHFLELYALLKKADELMYQAKKMARISPDYYVCAEAAIEERQPFQNGVKPHYQSKLHQEARQAQS